jgi:polyhydroxyalkanoate synthesis regulator phasin
MEDEKLQLLIGLFGELKKDIIDVKTDVKMDIRAVAIGQDDIKTEHKTNINDVETNVKGDISALEKKINAGQEELRREVSVFKERIRNIEAGQAAFEERVTCTVDTQLRNMSSMVVQQTRKLREDLSRNIEAGQAEFEESVTRNLREDLSRNIEATRQDVEATRRNFEATERDLGTQLASLQVQTRRAGAGNAGTSTDNVKPPKFDGSTSWVVFQRQFEAAAVHNVWTPGKMAAHFLSVLQGQAAHILHSVPAEASYEDIVGALRGRFGIHQLAAAYRSHLKARVQTCGETLQEFPAAVEQLAHQALVGLPEGHIQTEAAHAFIDGNRDREVKPHPLLCGACTLNEALNQALNFEAARAAAWPRARLLEVTKVPTGRPPTPPERRRNKRPVCWECGKPGHFWRDCRRRPRDVRDQASGKD